HQILTLMLSEPARVPPTARQRIYRLVKGPESIPYRRPPDYDSSPAAGEAVADTSALRPERLLTYLAALLVLALGLIAALWLAWPRSQPGHSPADVAVLPGTIAAAAPVSKPA